MFRKVAGKIIWNTFCIIIGDAVKKAELFRYISIAPETQ